MTRLWQILAGVASLIAAVFGLSWIKRKLEERGATRQRQRQTLEAVRVEAELAAGDVTIDAETEATVREIQRRQAERHRDQAETGGRTPTQEEIDRFINESR